MPMSISAVIPTYNRASMVAKAIESALSQTSPPAEIIVVDDGSSDDTRSVIESVSRSNPVRYIWQENRGVAAARNAGIRHAQSEWIAFLDSDDTWVSGHLASMASAIEQTEGAAALYFADLIEPTGHRYWELCEFTIDSEWKLRNDAAEWCLLPIQPMMLQASVLSRRGLEEIGGFPEQMRTREDTLLFFKIGLRYPVCAVKQCGTIMHAADSIRLTNVHDSRTTTFNEATIFMFRDILAMPSLPARYRETFLKYLSVSHFQMGKVLFNQHKYSAALKQLGLSFVASCK